MKEIVSHYSYHKCYSHGLMTIHFKRNTDILMKCSIVLLICGKQRQFKNIWVVVVYKNQDAHANWDLLQLGLMRLFPDNAFVCCMHIR
jgi:hypothetical protein